MVREKEFPKVIRIEGRRYFLRKVYGDMGEYIGEKGAGRLFLTQAQAWGYKMMGKGGDFRAGKGTRKGSRKNRNEPERA